MLAAKQESDVFPSAAFCLLAENSHRGHQLPTAVLHRAFEPINSNTATGFEAFLYDSGRRSRSTGKERDSETGLDYFGARYFSGAEGRFTSPDPKHFPHDIGDPQSWNKYGYTRNNPLRYTDPDGEDWRDALAGALNAFGSDNLLGAGRTSGGNSDFRTGQAVGDAVATVQGTVETLAGIGGEVGGTLLDFTGVGALVGVPTQIASAGAIVQGSSAAVLGAKNLGGAAIERRANDFSSSEKNKIDSANAAKNGGTNSCDNCGQQLQKVANEKGVPTPSDQLQRHHVKPASEGGSGTADNAKVLCPECHKEEHREMRKPNESN